MPALNNETKLMLAAFSSPYKTQNQDALAQRLDFYQLKALKEGFLFSVLLLLQTDATILLESMDICFPMLQCIIPLQP
jgi:hypothetical protein